MFRTGKFFSRREIAEATLPLLCFVIALVILAWLGALTVKSPSAPTAYQIEPDTQSIRPADSHGGVLPPSRGRWM